MDSQEQWQKQVSGCAFDLIDALNAPILTLNSSWADSVPKRILNIIPQARMIALMKREELATYEECSIYLYTQALVAPMSQEWTDIYTHVNCKTLEKWFGEDRWQDTGAPKELNDWLQSQLNRLRRQLYEKRREMLKKQMRNEEKKLLQETKEKQ